MDYSAITEDTRSLETTYRILVFDEQYQTFD